MTFINDVLQVCLAHPFLTAPGLVLLALALYEVFRPKLVFELDPKLPPELPIVGTKPGEWFSTTRAMFRNAYDFKRASWEAYKFKDKACIVPILDLGKVVMIPPSEAKWIADQPEEILSAHFQQLNTFQLKFTITDFKLVEDHTPIHQILINPLTRETNAHLPAMAKEAKAGVDLIFGMDTDKTSELCLNDHLATIVSRVANRLFVGPDQCSNMKVVDSSMRFSKGVGFTSIILRCTPQMLRPLMSLLVTGPQKIATYQYFAALGPEVRRRQAEFRADPEKNSVKGKKYNDFLQWIIEAAFESGDSYMMKPNTIMGRLLLINFVSIHIASMVLASTLFDLMADVYKHPEVMDELRDEIVAALKKNGGKWDKSALNDMPKVDSVFRESQRLNAISTFVSVRPVCKAEGITTPSGVHLPFGACVAVLGYPVMRDPELHPDPETFKPFRFAHKREEVGGDITDKVRQGWISVTPDYLAFGTPRHACPGRFFASNLLKVTLSYLLLNYDIEPIAERPANQWISVAHLPPPKATLKYRRRKESLYPAEFAV